MPAIAVRTALQLGYDGASFRVLENDQMTHRSLEATGSLDDPDDLRPISARMTDLARSGKIRMAHRDRGFADAPSVERLIEALGGPERSA